MAKKNVLFSFEKEGVTYNVTSLRPDGATVAVAGKRGRPALWSREQVRNVWPEVEFPTVADTPTVSETAEVTAPETVE